MNNLIQWPRAQYWDKPWNPVIGCQPISPACENCYAASWAKRFHKSFVPHASSHKRPPRNGVVFCGNMTDLFGEWAVKPTPTRFLRPIERWLSETLYYGRSCKYMKKGCVYLWLTKRVENMMAVLQKGQIDIGRQVARFSEMAHWARFDFGKDLMDNNYFGFTAEDQQRYSERLLPVYRAKEKWMQFWVSAEPLLGPLRLGLDGDLIPGTYKWLVVGCESGPKRRPCKIEWVESIVDQCRAANVPVFVKQLDLDGKCERDITKFPKHLQIRQVPWATKEG